MSLRKSNKEHSISISWSYNSTIPMLNTASAMENSKETYSQIENIKVI